MKIIIGGLLVSMLGLLSLSGIDLAQAQSGATATYPVSGIIATATPQPTNVIFLPYVRKRNQTTLGDTPPISITATPTITPQARGN